MLIKKLKHIWRRYLHKANPTNLVGDIPMKNQNSLGDMRQKMWTKSLTTFAGINSFVQTYVVANICDISWDYLWYFCFDIIFPKYSAHLSDWSPVLFELFICYVSSFRYFFYGKVLCQGHSFMSHQCTGVSIVVIQCVNPTVNFCLILSIIIALLIVTTVHTCCNCVFSALLTRLSIVYYLHDFWSYLVWQHFIMFRLFIMLII